MHEIRTMHPFLNPGLEREKSVVTFLITDRYRLVLEEKWIPCLLDRSTSAIKFRKYIPYQSGLYLHALTTPLSLHTELHGVVHFLLV